MAAIVAVAALAVTIGLVNTDGGGATVSADATSSRHSAPRPSTTRPSTTSPTTTAPPSTLPPTTLPPTALPPAAAAAPPPPAPRAKGPISVLVTGDSVGFAASFPAPTARERPAYITRIDPASVIGCGVLHRPGFTPVDLADEGAGGFGGCDTQYRGELAGLARRPNWVVMFSGGWEHLPWIPPGATAPLPALSPELRQQIVDELVRRADGAMGVGVRTAFVAWACPSGVAPTRTGDYARWYDGVLRDAAARARGSIVIEPTDRVCVGGDPGGPATAEKDWAFAGTQHPHDRRWLWNEWLGPVLLANS